MSTMVETVVGVAHLSVEERAAFIALVRQLEHELFPESSGLQVGPELTNLAAVEHLNELRARLGWLQVDAAGRWRWPV
jgi:hypothetical protein